jgi:hypothetical protein
MEYIARTQAGAREKLAPEPPRDHKDTQAVELSAFKFCSDGRFVLNIPCTPISFGYVLKPSLASASQFSTFL